MPTLLLIFLGGGAGSMARYGFMQLVSRYLTPGSTFPWPTLGVNLAGALIIGALVETLALRLSAPAPTRYLLVTGFLGGFTTFSAFSLETALMLERGAVGMAALYAAASVVGTVAAVFLAICALRAVL